MILKKPYAFLIKYFKLLHLILAALMLYLSIKINLITNLFNSLARNVSVSLMSLSDKYVTNIMYFSVILVLIIGFVIWFLMNNKKKPNKYYISLLIYYIIILVFLIVYATAMNTIETTAMTNQALRSYRDIAFLLPIGQYYFIVMAILRGIGFNIKQFNFSKDIKDLEISEEDSEEIEVNLSSNTYKYVRGVRKKIRELKYYFFENKTWILIILGILLISGLIYFFINYKFINNNYGEGSFVNAGNYSIKVNGTLIADKNLYGKTVKSNKKYVIVDISVKNRYYENVSLDTKKFRLFVGSDFYYSIFDKNSDFKDLGMPYDNKSLNLEDVYNYILIYELDNNVSIKNLKLKIYDNMNYETSKVNYVNINLNPVKLDNQVNEQKWEFNKSIVVDSQNFGTTNLVVQKYQVLNNYEYNYDVCVNSNCSKKTGVILPDNILKNKLIMIDYSLSIDKNSNLYNFVKNDTDFFNTFATLTYNVNGVNKNLNFNGIINSNVKNKIFMEVPKEIEEASEIELVINTRKIKYIYKLK